MNVLAKLIMVITLLVIVLFVSFKHNRTIAFDYNLKNVVDSNEHNQSSDHTTESTNSIVNNTTVETNTLSSTNMHSVTSRKNETTSLDASSNASPSDLLPNFTYNLDNTPTNLNIDLPESSETIYSEIIEVEKAIRKYISKGYKMSSLNSQNVKNAGFITEELSQKYDVTFRLSDGGYDIMIILKYPLSEETKIGLLSKPGVTLNGETVQYTFWVKAYR